MIDRKRHLDTFLEYVRIDSESLNERAMADRVCADLRALGAEVWCDGAGSAIGSNGNNVYRISSANSWVCSSGFSSKMVSSKLIPKVKCKFSSLVIQSSSVPTLRSKLR